MIQAGKRSSLLGRHMSAAAKGYLVLVLAAAAGVAFHALVSLYQLKTPWYSVEALYRGRFGPLM